MTERITAVNGEAPQCAIQVRQEDSPYLIAETNCEEDMGTVQDIFWSYALSSAPNKWRKLDAHTRYVEIPRRLAEEGIELRLVAVDDKENVAHITKTLTVEHVKEKE